MRLLKLSARGNFSITKDLVDDIPPYAILSHTWGADQDEVTFDDLENGLGKSKAGYTKIQFCGKQARKDKIDYFWVDTCCINKANNAELSEAITSMYRWYRDAVKCYVYLPDVSARKRDNKGQTQWTWESAFRKSKWFTRGWTLQELLAPGLVEFFSREEQLLGDKKMLRGLIHEITDIPITALHGAPLSGFPFDERLRWAAKRNTKKKEDKAYSLLGIFEVFMPLIYGEGDNAFIRLKEEINKRTNFPKSHWMVPFGRNQDFVGRAEIIDWLLAKIPPDKDKDSCQRVAIKGLGGVGKTQIALEAAFRVRYYDADCSIFWVSAVDVTSFENAYREVGRKLQVPGIDEDKADIKSLIKNALSQESYGRWLLIIDNADDTDLLFGATTLCDYLPSSLYGSILFTTRNNEVVSRLDITKQNSIVAAEMTNTEAIEMLQTNLDKIQTQDSKSTMALLQLLTYLPLAVKQASAYMAKTGMTTATYLNYCQSSDKRMIRLLSEETEYRGRYKGISNAVATTWLISFDHILRDRPLAANILRKICFLVEKDIPLSLILQDEDELELEEAVGTLKAYAFVTERDDSGLSRSFDVHRLVQLMMRNWLEEKGEQEYWVRKTLQLLVGVYPLPVHENREVWRRYMPHAMTAVRFQEYGVEERADRVLLLKIAKSYALLGKYREAEQMNRETLGLTEKVLGAEHPDTLASMNNLALVLRRRGKYEEAEQMQRQTLGLMEKVLGAEHPDTLASMNNLASVLWQRGKYEEAEQMYQETLGLLEKVLGAEHPNTLGSMYNLASVLQQRGKYEETEQMQRQTLGLREKVLGAEHPDTLGSMNNLASMLGQQGKYEEAEQMQRQTLGLIEKVLGAEHPNTLGSMYNLASVLQQRGKYEETEQMQRQTLGLREKVLGAEHPDTLGSMNNLASMLGQQGKYEEAEQMQRQTLGLIEKVLGAEHPDTLGSMYNLASVLQQRGKYEEAEQMQRQTLGLREKVLGAEHPDTLGSMNHLASVLWQRGKYKEAEQMQRQTLGLMEKVLGAEHPDTLGSMNNLASVLRQRGKYEEAEQIQRQTLDLTEKVLGAEHPYTLTSMNNLALVFQDQGKYEEAEQMQRQTLGLTEKVLGAEHPHTLASMNYLAELKLLVDWDDVEADSKDHNSRDTTVAAYNDGTGGDGEGTGGAGALSPRNHTKFLLILSQKLGLVSDKPATRQAPPCA